MITKKFGVDFHSKDGALTLKANEVCDVPTVGEFTKEHPDGWTITGVVYEDYVYWVNDFTAEHPTYGKVWGNFEMEVYADTLDGYRHFYANHPPEAWNYSDI